MSLENDTVIAGPVTARLAMPADGEEAQDCLWVGTLCVERPDGRLNNLVEGVARAPREVDRVRVELGDTFMWAPAGTTLVLLISGPSFPR